MGNPLHFTSQWMVVTQTSPKTKLFYWPLIKWQNLSLSYIMHIEVLIGFEYDEDSESWSLLRFVPFSAHQPCSLFLCWGQRASRSNWLKWDYLSQHKLLQCYHILLLYLNSHFTPLPWSKAPKRSNRKTII